MDASSDAASISSLDATRPLASNLDSRKRGRAIPKKGRRRVQATAKKGRRRVQATVSKKSVHSSDEIPSLDPQPALGNSDHEVASLEEGPGLPNVKVPAHEKLAKKAAECAHKAKKRVDLMRAKLKAISQAQRNVASSARDMQKAEKLATKAQRLEAKYAQMTKKAEMQLAKHAQAGPKESALGSSNTEGFNLDKDITPQMWKEVRGKVQHLKEMFMGQAFALEIYAGCCYWSGAVAEAGLNAIVPIEAADGQRPWADTNNPWVRAVLLTIIELGLVWYVHLATECKLWSNARTTGLKPVPVGVVFFTIQVLQAMASYNLGSKSSEASPWQLDFIYVSIENPWPSKLFFVKQIEQLLETLGAIIVKYDNCPFGANYKKRSQLRTNMVALTKLSKFCSHPPGTHDVLEGTVTIVKEGKLVNVWKTSLAAKYVPALCREWVEIMRSCAPKQAFTPPNQAVVQPHWQILLMECTGTTGNLLPQPTCPAKFVCPWANAVKIWCHPHHRHGQQEAKVMKKPSGRVAKVMRKPSGKVA